MIRVPTNHIVRIQNFTVLPTHKITASVKLADSKNNIWKVEIRDLTNNASFSRDFLYNSSRLSAEWIVEAPSIQGEITTLANFRGVTFMNCSATISNTTGAISRFPGYQLVLHDSHDLQLVDVSGLNVEGSGFNFTYSRTTTV